MVAGHGALAASRISSMTNISRRKSLDNMKQYQCQMIQSNTKLDLSVYLLDGGIWLACIDPCTFVVDAFHLRAPLLARHSSPVCVPEQKSMRAVDLYPGLVSCILFLMYAAMQDLLLLLARNAHLAHVCTWCISGGDFWRKYACTLRG